MAVRRTAIIVSEQWRTVAAALARQRIRVTLLHGKGGYQERDRTILHSVFTARAATRVKRVVKDVDAAAFIAIMATDDVTGVEVGNQPHW